MDVQISASGRVPVLTLNGRFDAFGALQFDETTKGIESDAPFGARLRRRDSRRAIHHCQPRRPHMALLRVAPKWGAADRVSTPARPRLRRLSDRGARGTGVAAASR